MEQKPDISVIICTHNPPKERLEKVLEHLRRQTLAQSRWELLLIDNQSNPQLTGLVDLSFQTGARIIREDRLGLTWARVRGIEESMAELIIFVDDDNLLEIDYLEAALAVAQEQPGIGVFGGSVELRFESPAPEWSKPYWYMLAYRTMDQDVWSGHCDGQNLPCGAGMCVRRTVAIQYAQAVKNDRRRQALDRQGANLSSAGDSDIAWTACGMGLGIGQTPRLKLGHIIPSSRLTSDYFLKLHEGMSFSDEILKAIHHQSGERRRLTFKERAAHWMRVAKMAPFDREMYRAEERGRDRASHFVEEIKMSEAKAK